MKNKQILIVLIVIFAFLIRFLNINFLPPSLNWDEISHGYNAYSILKTGKDEWGKAFPLIFRAYGDYKLPVYIYLVALSEFFLGLSTLAVRLPSIMAGTLSVLFTYLLVKELFRETKEKKFDNENLALISAFLLAIEPWSFFVSRIAVEANLALFFIISGSYFFIKGLNKGKYAYFVSAILFGLAVWTYNSARIFVPLLLVSFFVIYFKNFPKGVFKKNIFAVLILAFFLLPMFYQLVSQSGQARYGWVKILDESAINVIEQNRNTSKLPNIVKKIVFNKPVYFIEQASQNYFKHFTLEFLFTNGGSHYQFSVPDHGLLYLVDIPFFVFGLVYLVKNYKDKSSQLILFWLLLGPLASSITKDSPHALRSLVILPMPMIIISLGLIYVSNLLAKFKTSRVMVLGIYAFVVFLSVERYGQMLLDYRSKYSWAWQDGYSQMVDYLKGKYADYDNIVITKKYGEPHEFILFYWPWNPQSYQNDPNLNRFFQTNWYWVDGFDKFYFVNDWQVKDKIASSVLENVFVLESKKVVDCLNSRCLLITSPGNVPDGWDKLEDIKFIDGSTAFEAYDNLQIY